jgi:hypothetical protein
MAAAQHSDDHGRPRHQDENLITQIDRAGRVGGSTTFRAVLG